MSKIAFDIHLMYMNLNCKNIEAELIRKELTRLELENERLLADVQQQKQEVDLKVTELDKVVYIDYNFNCIYIKFKMLKKK